MRLQNLSKNLFGDNPMARKGPRDTTKALMLVAAIRAKVPTIKITPAEIDPELNALEALLIRMDARTGRRDPSTRTK